MLGHKVGVLQKHTLVHYLFIIVLGYVLRTLDEHPNLGFTLQKASSSRHLAKNVTDAGFIDNLSVKIGDADILLYKVEHTLATGGLHINFRKTRSIGLSTIEPMKASAGNSVKQVNEFTHLRSRKVSVKADIRWGIGSAWGTLKKLDSVWTDNLTKSIKVKLFLVTVGLLILYGLILYESLIAVMSIHWPQRMKNQKLYNGIPELNDTAWYRKLHSANQLSKIFFSGSHYKANTNEEGLGRPVLIHSEIIETWWSRKSKNLQKTDANGKCLLKVSKEILSRVNDISENILLRLIKLVY